MKKTLQKISFIALAIIACSASVSAVNTNPVLDASFFGFEMGDPASATGDNKVSGIFLQHNPMWAFSADQAATGSKSLKFEADNITQTGDYTAQIGSYNADVTKDTPAGSKITMDAGTYDVSIKVYVVSNPFTSVNFAIGVANGGYPATPANVFVNVNIPLGDVATDNTKWGSWQTVTVSQGFANPYTLAKSSLKVNAANRNLTAGATKVYIDDLTMTYTGVYVPPVSAITILYSLEGSAYVASSNLIVNSVEGSDFKMYNIAGVEIMSSKNISANYSTSISHLNAGLYIVKVSNKGKSFVQKVSVK